MANYINAGTRVFIPFTLRPSVFGTLVKYGSTGTMMGSGVMAYYDGGWRAYVLLDGDRMPQTFRPNSVVKDTPKNRKKHGIKQEGTEQEAKSE